MQNFPDMYYEIFNYLMCSQFDAESPLARD